ncbi:hypothetical protein HID58_006757 [Brassica napus]|uniref:Uncharacterized protein n=1 Tax=Brassica napus TaxID=3708 RepID=A0ABQ8ECF1_BRANA|nr:hypothetical protein HID58_006757 [Brassica napus]
MRFLFASSSSSLTDRFVGALDWNHPSAVVSLRGGKTRSRGGSRREKRGLHVSVVILGDGGYHRSVDAGCSPGGGGFLSFAAAGSSSREGEAFFAPFSPVLAPEGWLFGIEGMSYRRVDDWDELAVSPLMLSVTIATDESRSTVIAGMCCGVIRLSRQRFLG